MGKTTALLVSIAVLAVAVGGLYYALNTPTGNTGAGSGGGGVHVIGSGSTLLYPQLSKWIRLYTQEHPGVRIDYSPTGSGAGQAQFFQRVVDFAGSDPPLSREQWEKYRGKVLQVPLVATGVAVVYNLPGLNRTLRLDAETLAKIYRGEIEYWDDPAIARQNPGAKLPHEKIIVVHRSDASGTTMVFTYFLHRAAPHEWPERLVGKTVEWPVDSTGRGVGGKGNQGVVELVRQNPYSIAYVELAYALEEKLPVASIRNSNGNYVRPEAGTIAAALEAAAGSLPESPLDDWSGALNATIMAPGPSSYPITTLSFIFLWKTYPEDKARALSGFLSWIAEKGYNEMVPGYIALPAKLRQVVAEAAKLLEASG